MLRGCGGHDAFLRTYRGPHTDREAAQFLILDARFPRSIMHGLVAAADSLRKVTPEQPVGRPAVASSPTGRSASSGPAWSTPRWTTCWTHLDDEMADVQDVAAAVTATVSTNFFAAADPTAWITEGTR